MDARAQAIFREAKANPGCPVLEAKAERCVRRCFVEPAARFQGALRKGGALERPLVWELEFSRISVRILPQGGLLSCSYRFSQAPVHIRIWYPAFEDVLKDFLTDDVRIVISASPGRFSDTLESMEDYFPGATFSSALAARADPDGWGGWAFPKPARRDLQDKRKLAECRAAEGSTRGKGWGVNPWVA